MTQINLLAVLAAAVAAFLVGWLWYGPLFGKKWMQLTGMQPGVKPAGAGRAMFVQFLATVVTAFVLSLFIGATEGVTATGGAYIAFWIWLGFIATTMLSDYLFVASEQSRKPWSLYFLNALSYLVTFEVMGIILAIWK